ncbi:VWA domain-containing protein [Parasulfitobacter algicola]|uniref:VWA domain-containing protein n=1 Tax=Parasulfitobacter algicola TaxID=2614809 RepID=A0ABX2IKN7_9RHOB|nr:VWA domain-containing protein [Sulfitobacter algicola]NSX53427.1 VWA domain-containing protein [Sulfitobacter algicola]
MRKPQERWRLMLGKYADRQLGGCLSSADSRRDQALDYLYAREYQKRGIKPASGGRKGSLDPTQMRALDWLGEARNLFPDAVFETLQSDAIERYQLADLLKDPKVWEDLDPSPALLRTLLTYQDRADPTMQAELRRIAQKVIDDIMQRLRSKIVRAMSGRRNRHQRSPMKASANFDARATVRANLDTWDADKKRLIADQLVFMSRQKRHLDWTIVLCVDQSGSMTESLIFSALMAAILTGLPGIKVKMVLFDTSILDVTDQLDDPLDLLLSVQLGGGTDIGRAVSYCEMLVEQPSRTVLALVSDFYEGAGPRRLLASIARLNEARVCMLGIAALDDSGQADFDRGMAEQLAALGMNVAAMTPENFADWLAQVMK